MSLDLPTPAADHLDRLCRAFHASRIAQTFAMRLHFETAADGLVESVFEQPYDGRFDHILDDVHGGAIATLLDNAGWFAAAAYVPTWVVTVEFQTRLLEAAGQGPLRARGRVLRVGGRLITATMTVSSADEKRLVASGSGTFAVTRQHIPPDAFDANDP